MKYPERTDHHTEPPAGMARSELGRDAFPAEYRCWSGTTQLAPARQSPTVLGWQFLGRVSEIVPRKGECWDNAVAESFFATIKREVINDRPWPTRAGLYRAVFDYIEGWYNTRPLHSALGYLSPAEYKLAHAMPPDRRHDQLKEPVRRSGSSPLALLTISAPSPCIPSRAPEAIHHRA
jgi:Integrase core domain